MKKILFLLLLVKIIFIIKLTSVHSDECHFGLQSSISLDLQSSNVAGFAFKLHSLSSAKPSFLMQTTVRDLDALKQSPEQKDQGPINHSPWHFALLVHSRKVFGVTRMSHRSVFGGLRSQKIERNCWPVPHSEEHCSLLKILLKLHNLISFSFIILTLKFTIRKKRIDWDN